MLKTGRHVRENRINPYYIEFPLEGENMGSRCPKPEIAQVLETWPSIS